MSAAPLTSHLALSTPERVALELPIAGVGTRAIAWLIDAMVLFAAGVTLYFAFTLVVADPLRAVLDLSGTLRAAAAVGLFLALWVYWTALEVAWRGQTVGKRLVGVRVIRQDGAPVTIGDAAIRNLFRVVDFLPACYPVGVITMLVDPRHRRLGDLVAGTVLVRDERIDLDRFTAATSEAPGRPLTTEDAELLSSFLTRAATLEPAARRALGAGLAARLGVAVDGTGDGAVVDRLRALAEGPTELSRFVVARRAAWSALDGLLERQRRAALDLDGLAELDRLYRRAASDLAVARTRFPGSDVSRFLTRLCGTAYAAIYRPPPPGPTELARFFRVDFPAAVLEARRYIAVAGALLAAGAVLGALTAWLHPDGLATLVSPELRAFFERRELWTDHALDGRGPSELAVLIFTNNLRVSFAAFALGVTFGAGTVVVLVWNGLTLGALLAGAGQHGLLGELLTFIAAHGPLELSLIAIAGGAGLVIGDALLHPGPRPRLAHARERARLAVTLVLGCVPFFVLTGIVEGFVSPGPLFPWPVKLALGAAMAASFWRYALSPRA